MKTTYNKAVLAYKALERTARIPCNLRTARGLFDLRKALLPHFEFFGEREQQIIDGAGGKVDAAGHITFSDPKGQLLYGVAMAELGCTEIDVDAQPVTVTEGGYTPQDIWELDGFVIFADEGGEA